MVTRRCPPARRHRRIGPRHLPSLLYRARVSVSDATFAGGAALFAVFSAVRLLVPIIIPARSPFPVESSRSATDLALARIIFLLIYAQNVSFRRLPEALTAGSRSVKTLSLIHI